MAVSVYLNLAQLMFTHHCLSNTMFTEKYTKLPTSPNNLVDRDIRHLNTTLLKCTGLCSQLTHSCSSNRERALNMSCVTGSGSDETRKCVGFRFNNGECVLYKKGNQALTKDKIIKSQLYVQSGILPTESREESTTRSVSAVNDNSEFTQSTIVKVEKDKPQATFGSRCSKNEQCDYDHGLCLSGKCTCRIGHSFDFNSNTCMTHCKQYGSDVSKYPKSSVSYCNTGGYHFVLTIDICVDKCLREKSFVCVNAEFGQLKLLCYLCNTTWSDIDYSHRNDGTDEDYTLIYRHCANSD